MLLRNLIILSILLLFLRGIGQNQTAQNEGVETDTIENKNMSILLIPVAFYTPETSFAFGGGGQLFFKTKNSISNHQNSSVLFSAIYTLNKQLMIDVHPQIYFNNDKFFLDTKFKYIIFPNLFWGIGQNTPDSLEENYNQTEISLTATLLRSLSANVNFGFEFKFADFNITEKQEGGLLESGSIEGSDGSRLIGLGVVVNVDRRDNKFSPLSGGFYQFKTNFFSKVLGSTHSFNSYFLDLRQYINLGRNHILALQVYTRLTFGKSPFQGKSYYGGADVARGYFKGRYIDDNLYVAQIEYRLPIKKRWEIAAFVLTGNVGNNESGTGVFDGYKPSWGFGPRWFIYKNRRTLLRLDIAYNNEGGSGIYFGINEAF